MYFLDSVNAISLLSLRMCVYVYETVKRKMVNIRLSPDRGLVSCTHLHIVARSRGSGCSACNT